MSETTAKNASHPITFQVDAVAPATGRIWTEASIDHLLKRFSRKVVFTPESEKPLINRTRGQLASQNLRPELHAQLESTIVNKWHPLIDAVATAFSDHRPPILTPDSIWMVIEQGFAHHVT